MFCFAPKHCALITKPNVNVSTVYRFPIRSKQQWHLAHDQGEKYPTRKKKTYGKPHNSGLVYTGPNKFLLGQKLARLHGTGGTGRIFERLSVQVCDLRLFQVPNLHT